MVIAGCATDDADRLPVTDGTVGVDLALNVLSTPGTRGTTRMLPSAVKAESTFNGVEGLYVVPFVVPEERDTVQKGDTPKSGSVTGFTANTTVKTHYMTEDSDLPVGTNAFLCYAKAKPIGTDYDAAVDGSLTENLSTVFPTIPTVVTGSPADVTMGDEMKEATSHYIDELNRLSEMLAQVSEQSQRLTRDSEEMENLNRTLTGISRVYEMQLKSASSQISTIDEINAQTRHLADQIVELNKIYARMIEAMQVRASV